jgi:hypothetical protein
MTKSQGIRWAELIERMGRRGLDVVFWLESQNERDHYKDQDVGGETILKRILES